MCLIFFSVAGTSENNVVKVGLSAIVFHLHIICFILQMHQASQARPLNIAIMTEIILC